MLRRNVFVDLMGSKEATRLLRLEPAHRRPRPGRLRRLDHVVPRLVGALGHLGLPNHV